MALTVPSFNLAIVEGFLPQCKARIISVALTVPSFNEPARGKAEIRFYLPELRVWDEQPKFMCFGTDLLSPLQASDKLK